MCLEDLRARRTAGYPILNNRGVMKLNESSRDRSTGGGAGAAALQAGKEGPPVELKSAPRRKGDLPPVRGRAGVRWVFPANPGADGVLRALEQLDAEGTQEAKETAHV